MKNGQLPDHWQIWLWISLAALILAAAARQYAIDIKGMSGFNANLIFIGVFAVFALLYLAFHEFLSKTLGTAIVKCFEEFFKWLGFKERQPLDRNELGDDKKPESIALSESTPQQKEIAPIDNESSAGIVKIETPTPKKIVIDYEGRREQAKKRQEDRAYEKEEHVVLYIGYTMSPFVDKDVVEKIIDAVTEFIHSKDVPDFSEDMAIQLPYELTTSDMMHFGWNIAKPFKKLNLHTAHFLKQVFPYTFREVEVCTIERKLTCNGTQGKIRIDKNVDRFEVPVEDIEVETPTVVATTKNATPKPKKSTKISKRSKSANDAMAQAMADMELEPYNLGDNVLEEPDEYGYAGW